MIAAEEWFFYRALPWLLGPALIVSLVVTIALQVSRWASPIVTALGHHG